MITFQEVILRLQQYWNQQGCALMQPIDTEVGAGTSHTATFLRALGPEPWRAAYVQPSRRPNDARYGENPNRLHQHHQFQVVIKPSPTNIVDLYLGSLRALGIDTEVNDIRFVEDNWENPTLGAWGLGWEVWMNGLIFNCLLRMKRIPRMRYFAGWLLLLIFHGWRWKWR